MEASGNEAASQRTLCFVCGSQRGATKSSSQVKAVGPAVKRQRVEGVSHVEVHLVELIRDLDEANEENDKHYGLFLWPSALLLSRFVARQAGRLCCGKVVLELGCGTGLPSILAGKCGASRVYLTDRSDAADVQRNAEANIKINKLESCAKFIPLTWGDMHVSEEMMAIFQTVDVILAADCFYQSEDFEKVLATVALVIRCSGSACKFFFSYQLRSINRSVAPLLSRWGLIATSIDKNSLLEEEDEDFDSIYLYQVTAQQ